MSNTVKDGLSKLLCSAYAVEKKSLELIQRCVQTAENFHINDRLSEHLVETRWQLQLLKACMDLHGVDMSLAREEKEKIDGWFPHAQLKPLKRIEIDLYKKGIGIAREYGAPEAQQACREILDQERAMYEWLLDNPVYMNYYRVPGQAAMSASIGY